MSLVDALISLFPGGHLYWESPLPSMCFSSLIYKIGDLNLTHGFKSPLLNLGSLGHLQDGKGLKGRGSMPSAPAPTMLGFCMRFGLRKESLLLRQVWKPLIYVVFSQILSNSDIL